MFLPPISHAVNVSYTTLATLTVCPVTPVTDYVKKPKRIRTSYTETQVNEFEKIFVNNQYPSRKLMDKLSDTLDIPVERMRTWFQNRRSRQKKARQNKASKRPSTAAYHHTDTLLMDMEPSPDCLAAMAVHGWGSEGGMRHWSYVHTTHTPTTNQACMNCDSQTVYSTLYHRPVMTPVVVRSPGQLDEYSQRSSNRGSHFGNQPCYVKQGCMQLATPTAMGYTLQQPISRSHSPQLSMDSPPHNQGIISPGIAGALSGQQTGGYASDNSANTIYPQAINRNTHGIDNDTMYLTGTNSNNNFSGLSDNDFNPVYKLLVNVGQLQLSSYHMQVNTNATLCEQTYGGLDQDIDRQLGSRCPSVDGDPCMYFRPMETQQVVHTPPPQSTGSLGSHSGVYPWQLTPSSDFRSWNINRLLLGSQASSVDSLQMPKDDNPNRFRNDMSNSNARLNLGFRQHFRPGRETNLNFIQTPNNYVSPFARSTDDDTWSTRTFQDSDTESLESFGSGPCIRQLDMTASLLSEFGPYGPMSPVSFRGDTPHPEL